MRSNEYSVTNNDDNLVSGFDEYTFSGDSVCEIFDNKEEIITKKYFVWVKENKAIYWGRYVKLLSVTSHRIKIIKN